MAYPTDGTIGVDLDVTVAGTTTDGENAEFTLGTRIPATDDQVYVYAQAGEAISQYDFVAIDEDFQVLKLGTTEAGDGHIVGVAQVAFSDNDLGWFAVKGANLQGNVGSSCAKDVALWTTATDGTLDDASGTGDLIKIDGVVPVGSNTVSVASNVEILMTWPRSSSF